MKVNLKGGVAEALTTFFGLGHAPIAPGTFGTLGGLGLAAWVGWTWPEIYGWILPLMVVALSGVGIALGRWAENRFGRKDPGPFVLDEVAGYLIAAWWPAFPAGGLVHLAAAFLLFRVADILKPWPCRRLERLPRGWGIVLDDLGAGAWALGLLALLCLASPGLLGH